jgi:RNA polymerase sigma factor (TIGR02999 family)
MSDPSREAVTALLLDWCQGDKRALDHLIPLVYSELRRVARGHLKTERAQSLETTALVHETYLRLVDLNRMSIQNRTHFFAVAARLMRQILVDHARKKLTDKRGGGVTFIGVDDMSPAAASTTRVDILALDEALDQLARFDERLCRVVELKFFAGLNIGEAAEALNVSTATVERDWAVAKAWLYRRLAAR